MYVDHAYPLYLQPQTDNFIIYSIRQEMYFIYNSLFFDGCVYFVCNTITTI